MTSQASTRSRYGAPLAAALALLAAVAFTPAARADTSGSVEVFAAVVTELSLTLCDGEANFGTGLTSLGATPGGTTDAIGVTDLSAEPGQGVFYHWTPACQAAGTEGFLRVVSTSSWSLTPCATENAGDGASPTLTIANRDLRWGTNTISPLDTYLSADVGTTAFEPCDAATPITDLPAGSNHFSVHYYLQVDPSDAPGTFTTTTTWTATPE